MGLEVLDFRVGGVGFQAAHFEEDLFLLLQVGGEKGSFA